MKIFTLLFLCLITGHVYADTAVYFSPSLDCENNIIKLLNHSKKQIDIAVYSINNNQIVEAIKQAYDRGIPMRILTDKTQAAGKSSKVLELYQYGVNIKVHSKHRIEHNKFIISDNNRVITGSYNWTNPASLKNSENCLVIWDEDDTILAYQRRFDYLWNINTKEKSDKWFQKKLSHSHPSKTQ